VEFRLLGPVEFWTAGKQHNLGFAKERSLLAVLLLAKGRPVTTEVLIDRVWGSAPPAEVAQSLQVDLSRLRRRLRSATSKEMIRRASSHTYVLDVDPDDVDLFKSHNYRIQGLSMGDSGAYEESSRLLHQAESLWRGEPLAGLPGEWAEHTRVALRNDYRTLALELADVDLKLGRHSEMIGFLLGLVDRDPFDEAVIEKLMLAYYCSGRQVDAVNLYLATKELLSEDGLLPGPRLRDLHGRIVSHDPALRSVREPLKGSAPTAPLPEVVSDFTGRSAELAALTRLGARRRGAISIVGMPGVGKTSLAIKVAHELAPEFPDAQVFIDLHAHDDRRRRPVDVATALSTLLRAIGVAPRRIPPSLAEQARLLRGELIGRRVLILLDDAENAEQIRPLLPDTPDCLTIVTSRRTLDGLPGVRRYELGVLSTDDAVELFTRIAGRQPSLSRSDAAEMAHLSEHLPLALRLAATRVRDRQVPSVDALIEEMRDVRDDAKDQPYPELSAAFRLSYRDLDRRQQYVFRMIGLSPVVELTAMNVSALAGIPLPAAKATIEQLAADNLLSPLSPGRFHCHDLVRLYARSRSKQEDAEQVRRQAVGRSLDHHLRLADHADRLMYPYRSRMRGGPEGSPRETFDGADEAEAWMVAEWRNLYHLVHYCAEHGHHSHAIRLADAAAGFLDAACQWQEARNIHQRALRIAKELELPQEVAQTRLNLAVVRWRLGDTRRALQDAHVARNIYRELDATEQEAMALDRIGLIMWSLSDFGGALAYFEEASERYRDVGHVHGEANCLAHKGISLLHTGRYHEAVATFEKTIGTYEELNDLRSQANALNNLGEVRLRFGDHREATRLFTRSKEIYDSICGKRNSAILLINFGNVARYLRETRAALDLYRRARKEFAEHGDRINEANVLNNIGFALTDDERFQEALGHHRAALEIAEGMENRYEEARAVLGRAEAEYGDGRYAQALDDYQASCRVAREIGDPYLEALALSGMAKVSEPTAGFDAARIYWRQARDILRQLGDVPELAEVQVRLQRVALLPPEARRRIELAGRTGEHGII
jgi:DNA-binding SARP family transcriptional activator/Tfp pilus assembly protein PilF